MKRFFLIVLFPVLLPAQTVQLTEQLGKTVLYGDIALSPDGNHLAWVQSTAATTTKETYVLATSGKGTAVKLDLKAAGARTDFVPAWSPDSKTDRKSVV